MSSGIPLAPAMLVLLSACCPGNAQWWLSGSGFGWGSGSGFSGDFEGHPQIYDISMDVSVSSAPGAYPEVEAGSVFWVTLEAHLNLTALDEVDVMLALEYPNDNHYYPTDCNEYLDGTLFGCNNVLYELPYATRDDTREINITLGSNIVNNSDSAPSVLSTLSRIQIFLSDIGAVTYSADNAQLLNGENTLTVYIPVTLYEYGAQTLFDFTGHVYLETGEHNSTNVTVKRVGTYLDLYDASSNVEIEAGDNFTQEIILYNDPSYSTDPAYNITVSIILCIYYSAIVSCDPLQ